MYLPSIRTSQFPPNTAKVTCVHVHLLCDNNSNIATCYRTQFIRLLITYNYDRRLC